MSYVRSRRSRGFGQVTFAPGAPLTAFNTSQPAVSTGPIQTMKVLQPVVLPFSTTPPPTPMTIISPALTSAVMMAGNYPVCRDPSSPKKDGWGWENQRSCKQLAYPFCSSPLDTAGTGWGWENQKSCIVPIIPGATAHRAPAATPSAPATPAGTQQAIATMSIASSGGAKPGAVITPPAGLPGQDSGSGGGYVTPATGGSITPADFKSACSQIGGSSGTSCCKLPTGQAVGLDSSGQMVSIASCDAGGLGGSIPLIAGAAIAAVLLMRFM